MDTDIGWHTCFPQRLDKADVRREQCVGLGALHPEVSYVLPRRWDDDRWFDLGWSQLTIGPMFLPQNISQFTTVQYVATRVHHPS